MLMRLCWLLLQAELLEMRALVESLTRKNRHLSEELSEANRAQDTAHTQLLGLQVGPRVHCTHGVWTPLLASAAHHSRVVGSQRLQQAVDWKAHYALQRCCRQGRR